MQEYFADQTSTPPYDIIKRMMAIAAQKKKGFKL
jgi:hypothetical protein